LAIAALTSQAVAPLPEAAEPRGRLWNFVFSTQFSDYIHRCSLFSVISFCYNQEEDEWLTSHASLQKAEHFHISGVVCIAENKELLKAL